MLFTIFLINFSVPPTILLFYQDLSMIAPTCSSTSEVSQLTVAATTTVESAVVDREQENTDKVLTSPTPDKDHFSDDDPEFWDMVVQEDELSSPADNPTANNSSTKAVEKVCPNSPGSRDRASFKSLKRKLADPRIKKECVSSGKKKKNKATKRRRTVKKTFYDYHASLELGSL